MLDEKLNEPINHEHRVGSSAKAGFLDNISEFVKSEKNHVLLLLFIFIILFHQSQALYV